MDTYIKVGSLISREGVKRGVGIRMASSKWVNENNDCCYEIKATSGMGGMCWVTKGYE